MSNNLKVVLSLALILSYALGRYTAPAQKASETKDKVVDVKTDENKIVHTQTTTTMTRAPTGETTTVTQTDTLATTKYTQTIDESVHTAAVFQKKSSVNISLLVGYDTVRALPTYGALVSKEFLGPIAIGAFGLTNGTVGVSIGVNF